MKASEWREKNTGELGKELSMGEDSLRELRFRLMAHEEKKHRGYRTLRRDIARIRTILSERDREEGMIPEGASA